MHQNIEIHNPYVGLQLGRCKNCNSTVTLRQPWLSRKSDVNDGWYLVHCTNEDCHNHYGMELRLYELYMVDFVEWSSRYIKSSEPKTVEFRIIKGGRCV